MDFSRSSQLNNPELLICSKDTSQFIFEINLLRQMTTELASISGTCSTDDEDCREVEPITVFYTFSSISSTQLIQVSEEEEEEEGSGSGSGSMIDLCFSDITNTELVTTGEETMVSGSPPAHSRSATLLSVAVTVLLLAMGNSWLL